MHVSHEFLNAETYDRDALPPIQRIQIRRNGNEYDYLTSILLSAH
jgi:hypothetical protein